MKISHRDFRPPRRSKYVAQPLKRRPTLRILLLAGIGVAVYLKFDTVVASNAFQNLRKPGSALAAFFAKGKPSSPDAVPRDGLRWSADSGSVDADCASGRLDSCLGRWSALGEEALGTLRATLGKAESQWNADAGAGFSAGFRRASGEGSASSPEAGAFLLSRLELRNGNGGGMTLLRKADGNAGMFCASDRCLDENHPRPPFARYRPFYPVRASETEGARIPEAAFFPRESAAANPILRGRVMALPAEGGAWMKIYHGENVFSYYRGFSQVRPGLKAGSMVGPEDTLGLVVPGSDTLAGLEVRIEKDGLMVDPFAYLGLQPQDDAQGANDGR